jgi:hypothetical protein
MKHILTFIIFPLIATAFLFAVFFEMIWYMLHAFHYDTYNSEEVQNLPLPQPAKSILERHPEAYNIARFLFLLLSPLEYFYNRMKQLNNYKF